MTTVNNKKFDLIVGISLDLFKAAKWFRLG